MTLKYLYARLLRKLSGSAVLNSSIGEGSKIEAGTSFINSEIGKYSFCGYNGDFYHTKIGNFTSIANDVVVGGGQHPLDWVGMSPVFYAGSDSVSFKLSKFQRPEVLTTYIGSDVWIGRRAIIKQGVNIGHGAVVGMGSVVTKDVNPYEVVAGVPARKIRKRFDEDIIDRLMELKWWEMDLKELKTLAPQIKNVKEFLFKAESL